MRFVLNFWHRISTGWLAVRLLTSLSGFFVWFGWQSYVSSSVLLISLIWLVFGALLLIQQLLFWYHPTLKTLSPPPFISNSPVIKNSTHKLRTTQSFNQWCDLLSLKLQEFPTHRDLGVNASLCQTLQQDPQAAAESWRQAQTQDPNSNIFGQLPIQIR